MKLFKAAWFILTLRCEQSTRLASESLDRELSLAERFAVRCHEFGCRSCRRFSRQVVALRDAVRRNATTSGPVTESLSADARQRIRESLERAAEEESPQ